MTYEGIVSLCKRNGVPEHLAWGLAHYVFTRGYSPGPFLKAVLENDLLEAMRLSDYDNRACLYGLCSVIDNDLPPACHGSAKRVAAWVENGGLRQFDRERKIGA
jgi:hypothetical protein